LLFITRVDEVERKATSPSAIHGNPLGTSQAHPEEVDMPVELYESMFVIDTNKMATDADSIKESLRVLIAKHGGEILVNKAWNESQKLAYPIRKQRKAYYHIMYYKMESTKQIDVEKEIRLTMTDFMLRHLTSNVDPRYAEVMLHIAKEEQGQFALRGYHDEPSPTDITPANINDPGAGNVTGGMDMGRPVPNLAPAPAPARRPRRSDAAEKPE
jgi:small subunit ribosomal protein S6